MTTRKSRKKRVSKKNPDQWHLKVAFALGKSVKKASRKVNAAKGATKKRLSKKASRKESGAVSLFQDKEHSSHESLSPILKELKGLSDVIGLTAALEEMNEISLKHSSHPVINRLTIKLKQLSPQEQEMLFKKFAERLQSAPFFMELMASFPTPVKMTEEDCQKISDTIMECASHTLQDIGMTREEREFFQKFSDDVTRPLNELMQFYMHPKTFGQKVKRLWRMQRIIVKMIKLVNMSQALALQQAKTNHGPVAFQGDVGSNYWMTSGNGPIVIKETSVR